MIFKPELWEKNVKNEICTFDLNNTYFQKTMYTRAVIIERKTDIEQPIKDIQLKASSSSSTYQRYQEKVFRKIRN